MTKVTRIPVTQFVSAERVSIEIVHRQAAALERESTAIESLDSVVDCVFIVNQQRQIVFASRNLRALAPAEMRERLLGLRLGEALGCVHAGESASGCGGSEHCRKCGALHAILSGLGGRSDSQSFRLTRLIGCRRETRHFLAITRPLVHQHETFSIVALTDIRNAKARAAVEQLFSQADSWPVKIKPKPKLPPASKRPGRRQTRSSSQ